MTNDDGLITTDEAILSSIGEGDEQTTDDGVTEESSGETADTTEEASTASSEQSTDGSTNEQRQRPTSGPQDLVDGQGNVIARRQRKTLL